MSAVAASRTRADWNRALLSGAGLLVSGCAAAAGVMGVGPLVRWAFGPPHDYGSDYTSPQAFWHALSVLAATLGTAFALVGWLMARWRGAVSWRSTAWMANPFTVGLPFLALLLLLDEARLPDGPVTSEYIGPVMLGLQMLLAIPAYALAIRLGARAAGHPR